jgi:hypothetical protein
MMGDEPPERTRIQDFHGTYPVGFTRN